MEVATQVRVACGALASIDTRDVVVAAVRVDEERATCAAEHRTRRVPAASRGKTERHVEAAGVVLGEERPVEAVAGLSRLIFQETHAGLVGEHDVTLSNHLE